jgi:hypothetical protein
MANLVDRYIWGVLSAVPESQRADLEPEIRALVADAVEARTAAGTPAESAEAAERAALTELGDPELLASRYTDRTLYLIGPRYFLVWKRLLLTLLPIVVPLATIAVVAAQALAGQTSLLAALGSGLTVAYNVTIGLVFWFTLVFAIAERTTGKPGPEFTWSPDRLPDVPTYGRLTPLELALSVAGLVFAAVFIVWQQVASPVTIAGVTYPMFDPALWSFWLPWFLAVIGLEVVFTGALYRRGRWTWPFAVVNALLGAAFAIPAIWLLQTGQLWNPAAVDALQTAGAGGAISVVSAIIAITIAVIVVWDAVDGFVKAYRTSRHLVSATA